ncbi:sensor domain-containing diguanylate cyclase [Roseisalinus antarcticus]|uniref:diguanylate cyclase n=1 Tax=Roseisalinus antarcticus TaxID=254357 RepID=A0A1Y5RLQ2_9RHOB|nr:sensor domain-containing diguanylate cyclase [Roseisalinus antarcticus]SLN17549.1 Diguanylate cyclase DosC [Roseisalinus antarcticus]
MSNERTTAMWREDWAVPAVDKAEAAEPFDFANEIMDIMEQGILVWSPDGVCELHNARVFEVLELEPGQLYIGMMREEFRDLALQRGELTEVDADASKHAIEEHLPYSFDRKLPSGRMVLTNGRPSASGGYVVTFTDVTEARRAARDLISARAEVEAAEMRAKNVLATENARQHEARMLSLLDEWLQSCKTLDELYMIVTRFMGRVMADTEGEIYTYSSSRDVLDGVGSWVTNKLHRNISPDSCWSLRRGRAYQYDPKGICFVCNHLEHPPDEDYPCEYVCVPVSAHGDTVGLMHVRFDGETYSGTKLKDAMNFTVQCAEHISMAIANVRLRDELHEQSVRDPLTGLHNRRYFMDAMRREMALADRTGQTFGLISFDADKFKTFNDTQGHDAGDAVLQAIAAAVQDTLGPGEKCCRVGGEEFTVLLPGRDLAGTWEVAEGLRGAVEAMGVRHAGASLPRITISAGIAAYPTSARNSASLLKRADEALYAAKDEGRNRVGGMEETEAEPEHPRTGDAATPWHEPARPKPAPPAAATEGQHPTESPMPAAQQVGPDHAPPAPIATQSQPPPEAGAKAEGPSSPEPSGGSRPADVSAPAPPGPSTAPSQGPSPAPAPQPAGQGGSSGGPARPGAPPSYGTHGPQGTSAPSRPPSHGGVAVRSKDPRAGQRPPRPALGTPEPVAPTARPAQPRPPTSSSSHTPGSPSRPPPPRDPTRKG